jgi:hypothetical protein
VKVTHVRRDHCVIDHSLWAIGLSLALISGCGNKADESIVAPVQTTNLESGVVARVGGEAIVGEEVARIAAAQGVSVAAARELAIRDALFAAEAKAEGMDAERNTQLMINAALARRLLRKILDDADRAGPVTDEELARVMERRWLELDRPEGFRVVHAVVRTDEGIDEAKRNRAKVVAEAIREAVKIAVEKAKTTTHPGEQTDPVVEVFKTAAEAVERDGFTIKVEALEPVAMDGRVLSLGGGGYEKAFAEGAAKLAARGDLSDIVTTPYGLHVMLLLERIPEARTPLEERRRMVREEVLWMRSSATRQKLLDRLRPTAGVGREVETLLVMVPVDR